MNNAAEQLLIKERNKLITEKKAMETVFNTEISEIETAIERISGKKVWEVEAAIVYDDENVDYIKGSAEEL